MLQEQGVAGVVVSTSTWHASGPGSISGHDSNGIFGVKTLNFEDHVSLANQGSTLMSVLSKSGI